MEEWVRTGAGPKLVIFILKVNPYCASMIAVMVSPFEAKIILEKNREETRWN